MERLRNEIIANFATILEETRHIKDQLASILEQISQAIELEECAESDSFAVSSADEKTISSDSGVPVDGSDFSESDGLLTVEKSKRSNLPSKTQRDKFSVKKLYVPISDDDIVVKKSRRRKSKRNYDNFEDLRELPVDENKNFEVDEEKVEEELTEIVEKEAVDKVFKVLSSSPEPFVGMFCLISHMISPSEFYINPSDENITILENLSSYVADLYAGSYTPYSTKLEAMENLGSYCLCYLTEWNYWYRAEVINWHPKAWGYRENIVTVFLVDFGYVADTSYVYLRELPDKYCSIPKYAIKCHLKELRPVGSSHDNDTVWPTKTIATMRELLGADNENTFIIVSVEKERDSYAVDLVKQKAKENSKTLVEKLIEKQVAIKEVPKVETDVADGANEAHWDSTNSSEAEMFNSLNENVGSQLTTQKSLQGRTYINPCVYFMRHGFCGKRMCKYDHIIKRRVYY